jgi:hypothetical protein
MFLKENPEITEEIKQKIFAAGGFDHLMTAPIGGASEAVESEE